MDKVVPRHQGACSEAWDAELDIVYGSRPSAEIPLVQRSSRGLPRAFSRRLQGATAAAKIQPLLPNQGGGCCTGAPRASPRDSEPQLDQQSAARARVAWPSREIYQKRKIVHRGGVWKTNRVDCVAAGSLQSVAGQEKTKRKSAQNKLVVFRCF